MTALLFFVLPLIFTGQPFMMTIFSLVLVYTLASLGLNIVIGYAGQISIGHAAFMAIGAYFSALLTMNFHVPFLIAFLGAGVVSGIFGFLLGIPALRLKGFYLAIATMAFCVVVEQLLKSWDYAGGNIGIRNIVPPKLPGISLASDTAKYYLIAVVTFLIYIFTANILKGKTGRAFKAIRESEFAAQSMGINISRYKLIAFVISAVYAGFAGSLYAHTIGYISPTDFGLGNSINLLAIIVIGGLASLSGSFIGSVIMVAMPFLFSRTQIPMSIIFGVLLVLVVLFFPRGLAYALQIFNIKYLWRPYTALKRHFAKRKKAEGEFINVLGKKIHYVEVNKNAKKTIMFIHGNFASWRWFKPVLDRLSDDYRGIALDMPNFGRSDWIDEITIESYARYVSGFMKKLKIDKAIVVGHSLGGAVVQKLTIDNQEMIEKVLLIDPAPPSGYKAAPEAYAALELYKSNADLLKKALIGTMPTRSIDSFIDELVADALLMKPQCFVENAKALEKYDYREELKNLEIPFKILVGKQDLIISEAMAREFEQVMKNAKVEVIPDCGHSVNVEKPDLFLEKLYEFIK
ncbi:alpha/beta fold hydrolase [Kosmotoga pacifica]|nr:alpha/beta fold hydrolase [Kosmotoga pacifica]